MTWDEWGTIPFTFSFLSTFSFAYWEKVVYYMSCCGKPYYWCTRIFPTGTSEYTAVGSARYLQTLQKMVSSLKLLCHLSSVLTWLSCGHFLSFSQRKNIVNVLQSCVLCSWNWTRSAMFVWVSGKSQCFNPALHYKVAEVLVTAVSISSVFSVTYFCILCNFRSNLTCITVICWWEALVGYSWMWLSFI